MRIAGRASLRGLRVVLAAPIGQSPDYHVVRLEEDAKQIKVDQVRELIGSLLLKSYRGGYKVGIIEGAEALNCQRRQRLLKTLEEPSADTMLVMIARPTHRLPATIASRCLRLALRPPRKEEAVSWLENHGSPGQNWDAALALAGGAPLLAMELNAAGIAALEREMQEDVEAIAAGAVDITWWPRSGPGRVWACASCGLRTGSHGEYVLPRAKPFHSEVRNGSACLPLYLSPR